MKITRMRVTNFKSFADSGWINLSPALTVFVGENNAGKSALLQLFDVTSGAAQHRSPSEARLERLGPSKFFADLTMTGDEWESNWRDVLTTKSQTYLPTGPRDSGESVLQRMLSERSSWVAMRSLDGAWTSARKPSRPELPEQPRSSRLITMVESNLKIDANTNYDENDSGGLLISRVFHNAIFYFAPQRYSIGRTARSGVHTRLEPNAANLAGVLSGMYGKAHDRFEKLVSHVREVLSTVGNLSISPHGPGNTDEILIWPTHAREDENLAFPLDECGTGVAQVIAILTAAMTMKEAVIAVDEISSFLHPSASKALLRILLNEYPQHQYVLSTHSPEIISAGSAGSVYFVRKSGFESSVQPLDFRRVEDIKLVTGQLGIALTDVFSADRIIWVEGPTEEQCFPLLVEKGVPAATKFISVVATGDFTSKAGGREGLVYQVYEALSGATHSLVSSVTFSFDTEDLEAPRKLELTRLAKGRVLFLPRRNIESYLLDPAAISEVINAEMAHFDGPVRTDPDAVRSVFEALAGDPRFHAKAQWKGDLQSEPWLEKVDGAKLLAEVFARVCEGGVLVFSKTRHSPMILSASLKRAPEGLAQLRQYVAQLLALSNSGAEREQ